MTGIQPEIVRLLGRLPDQQRRVVVLRYYVDLSEQAVADLLRRCVRGRLNIIISGATGAGKTRTAVQAIVEAVRDDELTGPGLWVAQTDELCEQAVTSWAENWL